MWQDSTEAHARTRVRAGEGVRPDFGGRRHNSTHVSQSMRLIVTVGMPGSGKDELVHVAQSIGMGTLKMGDLVRDETTKRGLSASYANIAKVASEERSRSGPGAWAQRALPKITETKTLVDGCRSDQEVTVFRHNFGDLFVLGIYSSPETRYERLTRRDAKSTGSSLQDFFDRDRAELKYGIGNAFILADGMLSNEGSLEDFRKRARETLLDILDRMD
jgi:dephospho-CoA kinase